jgi:hypothetical protein
MKSPSATLAASERIEMSDLDAAARCASSGASALQREENGSNAQNENTEYEHDRDDWTLSWGNCSPLCVGLTQRCGIERVGAV